MNDKSMVLVYCPCPDLGEAKRLGHVLLDAHFAGCINILPNMVSLYDWQGSREEAQEAVLIAKTTAKNVAALRSCLEEEHPYDLPAILVLALADVNAKYRDWLMERVIAG